jgi:hypothetical protein
VHPQCPQALGGHGQMYNAARNGTAPRRNGGNGGIPGGIQINCFRGVGVQRVVACTCLGQLQCSICAMCGPRPGPHEVWSACQWPPLRPVNPVLACIPAPWVQYRPGAIGMLPPARAQAPFLGELGALKLPAASARISSRLSARPRSTFHAAMRVGKMCVLLCSNSSLGWSEMSKDSVRLLNG